MLVGGWKSAKLHLGSQKLDARAILRAQKMCCSFADFQPPTSTSSLPVFPLIIIIIIRKLDKVCGYARTTGSAEVRSAHYGELSQSCPCASTRPRPARRDWHGTRTRHPRIDDALLAALVHTKQSLGTRGWLAALVHTKQSLGLGT